MWKPEKGLTKPCLILTSMLLMSSCTNVNQNAICEATEATRDLLTIDLLEDGGPRSRRSGATLISQIDKGCSRQ